MATTSGSPDLVDHRSETNAVAVQRLIDAGAIVYAKTNLPIFAGDLQSYNDLFGTTSNPWDPHRTAGGSSGGAAAALATGMTPLELGSDIGGSIRNPAALCGVYGHKPTHGLISMRGHIPGPPGTRSRPDLAVTGPMARSPIDIELSMELLAGPDGEAESRAWRYTMPPARHERVEEFRVGVWFDSEICPIEHEVRDHLDSVVDSLEAAGVRVDRDARPDISEHASHRIYEQLLYGQMATGVPLVYPPRGRCQVRRSGPQAIKITEWSCCAVSPSAIDIGWLSARGAIGSGIDGHRGSNRTTFS